MLKERGLVAEDEIAAGHSLHPPKPVKRILSPGDVAKTLHRGGPTERETNTAAAFKPGDKVRAKNINPPTHTRLPRYVRGHVGTIERMIGCHVFPDSNATGAGENPQWLYTVRFDGRELWGDEGDPTSRFPSTPGSPIWSRPDMGMDPQAAMRAAISVPGVPRDADGPVFREPWEAQAFAMTLALHERGVFTWPEWAAALAAEIKRAQAAGDPDTGETYYSHWLNTLEKLVAEKGVTTPIRCIATATHGTAPATARRTASRSSCVPTIFAKRPSGVRSPNNR